MNKKPLSYRLGRLYGRLSWMQRLLALASVGAILFAWSAYANWSAEREQHAAQVSAQAIAAKFAEASRVRSERAKSNCLDKVESTKRQYNEHFDAKRFADAATVIRDCAHTLQDQTLLTLLERAEIQARTSIINDAKRTVQDRIAAIQSLQTSYPEAAKPYHVRLLSMVEQAEKQERAHERAQQRIEGVHIGMSDQAVLQSSWGRPDRVNRSIYSFGTREQWVYGSGNYLYFEDRILTSIQTGGAR